jgi:hypothetical protein
LVGITLWILWCFKPWVWQKILQELWEENLSSAVSLEVLGIIEKFSVAAASRSISTDYAKLDCVTSILMGLLSRSQPLTFWKAFLPVLYNIFSLHGATLMSRENDRFLKQIAFHLLRLAVFRNDSVRKRAVLGLQILVRVSCLLTFSYIKSWKELAWYRCSCASRTHSTISRAPQGWGSCWLLLCQNCCLMCK